MKLTVKQEKFCLVYFQCGDASEAYRQVYDCKKMKPATINRTAHELLKNPKIAARIEELRSAAAEKAVLTESRVLEEAARIGLCDSRKLFNEDGALKAIHELDADVASAIAAVEVEELFENNGEGREHVGRVKKIKMWDKNSALEQLFKHLGMYEKDNKQRAGMFENVPRATMEMIEEKLRGLVVARDVASRDAASTTH